MKIRNYPRYALWVALLLVSQGAASAPDKDLEERVNKSVKTWSASNKIGVTDDVVQTLTQQAASAVDDVSRRNQTVSKASLEKVAPRAVVEHLSRSQDSGTAPPVAGLVEQLSMNAGSMFPQVTNFPTLKISITPPTPADFSVSIDGTVFNGGLTNFRIAARKLEVVVTRAGKALCRFVVDLQPGEVRTESCPRP